MRMVIAIAIILLLSGNVYADELMASWYSIESLKAEGTWKYSQGIMANGKQFDENAFTCACRLYPIGYILRITNLRTNKEIIVKVTDRIGKRFAKTRIDLSKQAFREIANLREGVIPIKVEVLKGGE